LPVFGAVDIGSNSVRLKIGKLVRGRLVPLHEDREVTRLGESVFQTGVLSPESIEQTVKVLKRFQRATQQYGAKLVRVVATSAIRDANNASVFTRWVSQSTGWHVEVISGLEEGRLIHLGILSNLKVRGKRLLLIDLGGGSCELTVSARGHIEELVSLPLGAVRLTRDFLAHDPPHESEIARLRSYITEEIGRVRRRLQAHEIELTLASSGTPAALAASWAATQQRDTAIVPRDGLFELTKHISTLDMEKRRAIKGIGPRRAEIIVAGAWVFTELFRSLKLPNFRYVPYGLRDGLLEQMAAEYSKAGTGVSKRLVSDRAEAVRNLATHYQVDLRFAERVRNHCEHLFHSLMPVHNLPAEYEDLVEAGALLEEIGSFVSRVGRRRHAYYLVTHSELLGYTVRQRRIVAALVRFLGKSRPTPGSTALQPLAPADRLMIPRAAMILRLARALERSRRGLVTGTRVTLRDSRVTLRLQTKGEDAELELWALEREKPYFREVFGRDLDWRVD
jgi:exopolyphosphatase/guanosine-5'-triphosphate,3'-diphosphate pyrophosphatase